PDMSDYHENAVAQASSLHADKMSALHFHRDGCANVHDNSSENKFVVSPLGVELPQKVERLKATRQTFIFIIIGCRDRPGQ
ncbi:MAG: hypothetical protein ONA90_08425, partial [candidate division KSB1 bacterium]|nr:hypothetical protein [candidate division KSB1 bacterium]